MYQSSSRVEIVVEYLKILSTWRRLHFLSLSLSPAPPTSSIISTIFFLCLTLMPFRCCPRFTMLYCLPLSLPRPLQHLPFHTLLKSSYHQGTAFYTLDTHSFLRTAQQPSFSPNPIPCIASPYLTLNPQTPFLMAWPFPASGPSFPHSASMLLSILLSAQMPTPPHLSQQPNHETIKQFRLDLQGFLIHILANPVAHPYTLFSLIHPQLLLYSTPLIQPLMKLQSPKSMPGHLRFINIKVITSYSLQN